MSAQLSRRYGRVVSYPPLFGMPLEDKFALNRLTLERQTEFEDLPERYQQLILEAEATRQRHLEAIAAGTPHALDHLWDEAAAKSAEELASRVKPRSKRPPSRGARREDVAALIGQ
jgi:hypothetical protein